MLLLAEYIMKKLSLLLILCLGSSVSFGQKYISFQFGSTDRSLQKGPQGPDLVFNYSHAGLQYSYQVKAKKQVFGGVDFGFQSASRIRYFSTQVGQRYFLSETAKLNPFAQFSGEILFDNSFEMTTRDIDLLGTVGAGLDYNVSPYLIVRGSVNLGLPFFAAGSFSPFINKGSNFSTGFGLVYQLHKIEVTELPLTEFAKASLPPLDTDSDGVPDSEDRCPAVKGIAENQGCPPEVPAPVIAQNTVQIAKVETAPVAVVETPPAPAKEVVSQLAALPVEKPVNLDSLFNREIFFATAKSWLGPMSTKSLDQIVELMGKYPEVEIHLKGYTDHRSSVAYNQILSLKRVTAVKKYLVTQGVIPSRFKAEAFAEDSPVSTVDLQLNRRVEVRIWR